MHCYRCGADIGEQVGLCEGCGGEKQEPVPKVELPKVVGPQARPANPQRRNLLLSAGVLAVAVIACAWYLARQAGVESSGGEGTVIKRGKTMMTVQRADGRAVFSYRVGRPAAVEGHLLAYTAHSCSVEEAGVCGEVHYLLRTHYERILEKYGSLADCPSEVLDIRTQVLLLVPHDPALGVKLQQAGGKREEAFSVEGSYLTFMGGSVDGQRREVIGGPNKYFSPVEVTIGRRTYYSADAAGGDDLE